MNVACTDKTRFVFQSSNFWRSKSIDSFYSFLPTKGKKSKTNEVWLTVSDLMGYAVFETTVVLSL